MFSYLCTNWKAGNYHRHNPVAGYWNWLPRFLPLINRTPLEYASFCHTSLSAKKVLNITCDRL